MIQEPGFDRKALIYNKKPEKDETSKANDAVPHPVRVLYQYLHGLSGVAHV